MSFAEESLTEFDDGQAGYIAHICARISKRRAVTLVVI